jgi:protein-tyrosine phosphatase
LDYVDLHSHVLWGIDDGARTPDDSLEMLQLLREIGFRTVYATPHQKVGSFVPDAEAIAGRYDDVRARLQAAASDLVLHVGAENFWDELLLTRAGTDEQPAYREAPPVPSGKATPAFLFELPTMQLPPRLGDQLFAFRLRGRLPVLAHPERYAPLWGHWDRLAELARCAALVVDLPALDGAHGPERAKAARHIVQEGLCHAVASDIHQAGDARAVAAGVSWIRKRLGPARLKALLSDAPRQIVAGELPDLPA